MKRIMIIVMLSMLMFLPIAEASTVFVYEEDVFPLYAVGSHYVYTIESLAAINLGGTVEILNSYGTLTFYVLYLSEYENFVNGTEFEAIYELALVRSDGMTYWNCSIPEGVGVDWKFVYWKSGGSNEQMDVEYRIWNWAYYPITNTTTTGTSNTTSTTTGTTSTNTGTSTIIDIIGPIDPYLIIMIGIISMGLVAGYMILRKKKPTW